ncbi:MAG TPA: anthrone oxygenase family protein [Jiangellaceae bacterium]|nr:anthrone oxygenase family protein [Jiangellaceae bacterium]
MDVFRDAVLILATVSVGLMAGVFFAYAVAVMPGLARTDDRTFVGSFQAMDRAIINPLFLVVFVGALAITVLAGAAHLGEESRPAVPWILAAAVLYLVVFVITVRVNVPLNDAIKAAGDPDQIDVAAVRERFSESTWVRWNVVRTVLTTAALGCLGVALAVV